MHKKKGFTLVELMVVIAIIAVLAAVVAPQVFRQIEKGRVATIEGFANNIKTASTSYFSENAVWPVTCASGACNTNAGVNGGFVTGPSPANARWNGPYIDRWPAAGANPWAGDYNWFSANTVVFNGVAAQERYITITAVPQTAAQRMDQDLDGALAADSGKVRSIPAAAAWPAGNSTVAILVSRDGPVN